MSMPSKHRLAFEQRPLANDQSNHTWLDYKEPERQQVPSKLLSREGLAFKDSYKVCNTDDVALEGAALRDAVLQPAQKTSEGIQDYSFITAAQAESKGLRLECAICPVRTFFKNVQHFKKHFGRHPTTTAIPTSSSQPSSSSSSWAQLSAPNWTELHKVFSDDLLPKLRQMIRNPEQLPHFKERHDTKNGDFAIWEQKAHAGYFGPNGERRFKDWIHSALHAEINRRQISPLTHGEFVHYILMPIVAVRLIQWQNHLDQWASATSVWATSRSYGIHLDDDEKAILEVDGDNDADTESSDDDDDDDEAEGEEEEMDGDENGPEDQEEEEEEDYDDPDDETFSESSDESEDLTDLEDEDFGVYDTDELSYATRKAEARNASDARDAWVAQQPAVVEGLSKGWPRTMTEAEERERFEKIKPMLNGFILKLKSSFLFQQLISDIKTKKRRKEQATIGLKNLRFGFYGPLWANRILPWLRSAFIRSLEDDRAPIRPAKPEEFLQFVLLPHAIILMISKRLDIQAQEARQVWQESHEFGDIVNTADQIWTDEEDDDTDGGEAE
ncbi:hypothetical protein OC844_006168 [Tilletia horrida]|nr:hypothetical protein OC844_006168 [Tilletia horrida]